MTSGDRVLDTALRSKSATKIINLIRKRNRVHIFVSEVFGRSKLASNTLGLALIHYSVVRVQRQCIGFRLSKLRPKLATEATCALSVRGELLDKMGRAARKGPMPAHCSLPVFVKTTYVKLLTLKTHYTVRVEEIQSGYVTVRLFTRSLTPLLARLMN